MLAGGVGQRAEGGQPLEAGEGTGFEMDVDAGGEAAAELIAIGDDAGERAASKGEADVGADGERGAGDEADATGADVGDGGAEGRRGVVRGGEFDGRLEVQREAVEAPPIPGHWG